MASYLSDTWHGWESVILNSGFSPYLLTSISQADYQYKAFLWPWNSKYVYLDKIHTPDVFVLNLQCKSIFLFSFQFEIFSLIASLQAVNRFSSPTNRIPTARSSFQDMATIKFNDFPCSLKPKAASKWPWIQPSGRQNQASLINEMLSWDYMVCLLLPGMYFISLWTSIQSEHKLAWNPQPYVPSRYSEQERACYVPKGEEISESRWNTQNTWAALLAVLRGEQRCVGM